jgi:hypothetical protein
MLTLGTAASLYVFPPAARLLAFLLTIGGIGLLVISQIHCLHASDEDGVVLRLMFRYVPFFAVFHILSNWSDLKPHSTTWAIGGALMFVGIGLERTAKHFDGLYQQQTMRRQQGERSGLSSRDMTETEKTLKIPPRPLGQDTRQQIKVNGSEMKDMGQYLPMDTDWRSANGFLCRKAWYGVLLKF